MHFRQILEYFLLWVLLRDHFGCNCVFAKQKKLSTDGELLKAAGAGNLERVTFLIEEEMGSLSAKNNYGVSAIILAANNGHSKVVEALLRYGAPLEDRSNNGKTALHWACHWGHFSVVQFLVERGANILTVDYDGMTLLMTATLQNHPAIVQYLIEKEVDLFAINKLGADALTIAKNKQIPNLTRLLERAIEKKRTSHRRTSSTSDQSSSLLSKLRYDDWKNVGKDRNPYYIMMKLLIAEAIFMLEIGRVELLFLGAILTDTKKTLTSVFLQTINAPCCQKTNLELETDSHSADKKGSRINPEAKSESIKMREMVNEL